MPRDEQLEFLKLEYSRLRGEYGQFITAVTDLLKWATMASGALFAWLLVHSGTSMPYLTLAWWLPLSISVVFGTIAWALDIRNARKLLYLADMEAALFKDAPGVGFERHQKDMLVFKWPPPPEPMFRYAWGLLMAGNLAVACWATFI